ncbi:MAG: hypothetical protein JNN02_03875 [Tabrizicola sp.]|nr:hypothetical protein [Tabrizicola sp.]
MPLPLAPLLPVALRIGLVATTSYAVTRWVRARTYPGRTDQRAEDALDDLGEGLSLHRPSDRAADHPWDRQTNASARLRRVIRFGGRAWEVDASAMARFRLRSRDE